MRKQSIRFYSLGIALILLFTCFSSFSVLAEEENIALGMEYTFEMGEPTVHSYSNYSEGGRQYDRDQGKLTDGRKASEDHESAAWVTSFRSGSRLVTFDFGSKVTITGIQAGFWHGNGYYAPRYVRLFLSDNGEDWFLAGTGVPPFALNSAPRLYRASVKVDPYAARFVRVEYAVDIFTLCDEIEVFGSRTVTSDASSFTPDPVPEKGFCTGLEGDSYGITDIIKIYNGYYPSNQKKVNNDIDDLLPYVAYLDTEGNIVDTMFDAVAFVPCVSTDFAYPSGGTLVHTNRYPSAVMSDWVFYTDFLFADGLELDALDKAAGKLFSALGKEGKYPVLLTMPFAGVLDGPFGDINGDGKAERSGTKEERAAIVGWYCDYLTKRFEEKNYVNLDFVGFYWYDEEVNSTWSEDEEGFVKLATETIRSKGKTVLFDAFYLSTGYDEWQELGFSGAVMQPNMAFTDSRPYFDSEMIWEYAQTIQNRTLGVEIETNEPSFFAGNEVAKHSLMYEKYLYAGMRTGYMDAIHTFYQGAGPGTLYTFCHADTKTANGKRLRRLYDITHDFIHSDYVNEPPKVSLPSEAFETVSGVKCSIPFGMSDPDSLFADITVTVEGASNGRAQAAADKSSVIYLPNKDFVGTEELTISVSDGLNNPVTFSVNVNVSSKAGESSSEETSASVSEPAEASGSVYAWFIGGAALLMLAGLVVLLVRKKKNTK